VLWCCVGGCGKERGGIGVGEKRKRLGVGSRKYMFGLGLGLKFNPYFLKTLLGFYFLLVCLSLRMDDHALLMSMLMGSLDLTGRLVLRFAKHVLQ